MKAIVYDRPGDPAGVLQVRDITDPMPRFRQVRVRMLAAPINPSDLLTIEGRYGQSLQLPATPGYEGVGIVEANGGGLLGWLRNGKRVALISDRGGTWAETCIVSSRQIVPVPDDVADEQACMFFVNPVTAIAMTQHVLRVPRGSWLLQTAAGSALGQMVIRLGELHGFRTINVVRRRQQAEQLRARGGDVWICEADENILDRVHQVTDGRGVPFVLDPVGGASGTAALTSLAPGGQAILYGILSGQSVVVDPRFLITGSKRVQGFWLSDWLKSQSIPTMLRVFRQVKRLLRDGVFKTEIAEAYPMERIQEAARHVQTGARGGKVILKLSSAG